MTERREITFRTFKKYCGHKEDWTSIAKSVGMKGPVYCNLIQDYGETLKCIPTECPVWKRLKKAGSK